MAGSSTWIVVAGDRTPVGRVACRTLRKRLEAVWSELRACCGPRPDPERVHQLRVATRRTLAAIEAFDELLPAKRRAWFAKRLRRLRRAAGDARDLDVLTARLCGQMTQSQASPVGHGRARLVAMLSRQRIVSRRPIHELRDELVTADWTGRVDRLIGSIAAADRGPSFGDYARGRFRPLVERFFAKADRRLRDEEEIHRLRIEGKKLRYALEIFAGVFPRKMRKRCQESLERLQESLGEFTDHAAAADRFRRWAREDGLRANRDTLTDLRREEADRADSARRAFAKWWNPTRRRSLRRTFERTLRRDTA
jgi:CHAD domain-containing protein